MKHEKLSQALNEVRDQYIEEAAKKKRRSYAPWVSAVAAVLALVILAGIFLRPHATQEPVASLEATITEASAAVTESFPIQLPPVAAELFKLEISSPVYPTMAQRPADDSGDFEAYKAWNNSVDAIHNQPYGYGDVMIDYFKTVTPAILADTQNKNPVCSPVNIYMALAMLAETADGETRQELLDFLGVDTIDGLRELAGHIWNGHYWDDGVSTSVLGNSLWLDSAYTYNQSCTDDLAQYYYASSFSGNLGTDEMNEALQSWLNEQTGGLLEKYANTLELDPLTVFALASTIYYKVNWVDEFNEDRNTEQTFHGKEKDITATFMNTTLSGGAYYTGAGYGATHLSLLDGSKMWLILPDEGVDPNTILGGDDLWNMLQNSNDAKHLTINLSVPKFKVDASMELKDLLGSLGLTNTMGHSPNFSSLVAGENNLVVDTVTHAATVEINEEGVAAAAFTVIAVRDAGVTLKPDEIDFVLDRPFIFIIQSSDGLPLFAGVVNQL